MQKYMSIRKNRGNIEEDIQKYMSFPAKIQKSAKWLNSPAQWLVFSSFRSKSPKDL
ncbi:hypothetical protein J2TS4_10560 [Paenibacillus sp. J2TS4]|nr:hypothetical protein J2TS4_10560 [Paenibacillus sp. J2TS4]